ncbi:hypothetical protein CRUP_018228, partial [Coryphaenoides rupestris]
AAPEGGSVNGDGAAMTPETHTAAEEEEGEEGPLTPQVLPAALPALVERDGTPDHNALQQRGSPGILRNLCDRTLLANGANNMAAGSDPWPGCQRATVVSQPQRTVLHVLPRVPGSGSSPLLDPRQEAAGAVPLKKIKLEEPWSTEEGEEEVEEGTFEDPLSTLAAVVCLSITERKGLEEKLFGSRSPILRSFLSDSIKTEQEEMRSSEWYERSSPAATQKLIRSIKSEPTAGTSPPSVQTLLTRRNLSSDQAIAIQALTQLAALPLNTRAPMKTEGPPDQPITAPLADPVPPPATPTAGILCNKVSVISSPLNHTSVIRPPVAKRGNVFQLSRDPASTGKPALQDLLEAGPQGQRARIIKTEIGYEDYSDTQTRRGPERSLWPQKEMHAGKIARRNRDEEEVAAQLADLAFIIQSRQSQQSENFPPRGTPVATIRFNYGTALLLPDPKKALVKKSQATPPKPRKKKEGGGSRQTQQSKRTPNGKTPSKGRGQKLPGALHHKRNLTPGHTSTASSGPIATVSQKPQGPDPSGSGLANLNVLSHAAGFHAAGLQGPGLYPPGLHPPGLHPPGLPDLHPPGLHPPGLQGPGLHTPGLLVPPPSSPATNGCSSPPRGQQGPYRLEQSGAITVISTTSLHTGDRERYVQETTPTKNGVHGFLESPGSFLDTPTRNLLNTPSKKLSDLPSCQCMEQIVEKEEGPYYTHLGAGPTVAAVRELMENRYGEKGNAVRMEVVVFTGREGRSSQGCPIAKWVIRRGSEDEKLLCLVRRRSGHHCQSAVVVVLILAWEGVARPMADRLYRELTDTLCQHGSPTSRRCALNEDRTCACQGLDPETCGASFSFGCSWSMYFNGCKFARSKFPRKFRLLGDDPNQEEKLEHNLQSLATDLAPVYQRLAPEAFQNQVDQEQAGSECRLGLREGRPFSGVTACVDFCAHAHKDVHNMNNGSTVVCTLTREDNRAVRNIPEDEQLHVLPLYKVSERDEFGRVDGQVAKIQTGALQVLSAFPREVRLLAQPVKSARKRRQEAQLKAQADKLEKKLAQTTAWGNLETPSKDFKSTSAKQPSLAALGGSSRPPVLGGTHPQGQTLSSTYSQSTSSYPPGREALPLPGPHYRPPGTAHQHGPQGTAHQHGPQGTAHQHGPQGTVHHHGPQGTAHQHGPQGTVHHHGPQGTAHQHGPQGTAHQHGPQGTAHHHGPQGPAHHHGPQGTAHHHGPQGPAHQHGPQGTAHQHGPQGPAHQHGPQGTAHQHGPQGTAHQHGPQGTTHQHGPQGTTHQHGVSGAALNGFSSLAAPRVSPHHLPPADYPHSSPFPSPQPITEGLYGRLNGQRGGTPGIGPEVRGHGLVPRSILQEEVKQEEVKQEEVWSDSEHNFLDDDIGGVAVAPSHGSVLIECARRELHATTPILRPDRGHPTRISLVFYQHKALNEPGHGMAMWDAKMARREREREEEAERLASSTCRPVLPGPGPSGTGWRAAELRFIQSGGSTTQLMLTVSTAGAPPPATRLPPEPPPHPGEDPDTQRAGVPGRGGTGPEGYRAGGDTGQRVLTGSEDDAILSAASLPLRADGSR